MFGSGSSLTGGSTDLPPPLFASFSACSCCPPAAECWAGLSTGQSTGQGRAGSIQSDPTVQRCICLATCYDSR
ncbi:hypothetical protein BO71DRAFT_400414 [Aspergillus ellipticus CBS 707.79]|uniref:Uncharacterized protein n=1 Tax=Aspergillus ellipticus CBS 707.79 TaxID=1448320 RepID=A0A319DEE2_9EURO|nr:hypothetical protein BO71DRAFT_400414 [Aspergillus ellipticus CBS 707.79]